MISSIDHWMVRTFVSFETNMGIEVFFFEGDWWKVCPSLQSMKDDVTNTIGSYCYYVSTTNHISNLILCEQWILPMRNSWLNHFLHIIRIYSTSTVPNRIFCPKDLEKKFWNGRDILQWFETVYLLTHDLFCCIIIQISCKDRLRMTIEEQK